MIVPTTLTALTTPISSTQYKFNSFLVNEANESVSYGIDLYDAAGVRRGSVSGSGTWAALSITETGMDATAIFNAVVAYAKAQGQIN